MGFETHDAGITTGLYQLSYSTNENRPPLLFSVDWCARQESNLQPPA